MPNDPVSDVDARKRCVEALDVAVAHLRERGDFEFLNDEPEIFTTLQLASLIEQLAEQLATGEETAARRLWGIFAVASTWDDAGGDSRFGQHVFELVDALYPSS